MDTYQPSWPDDPCIGKTHQKNNAKIDLFSGISWWSIHVKNSYDAIGDKVTIPLKPKKILLWTETIQVHASNTP